MNNQNVELMAHMMRRVGFGAHQDEIDAMLPKGYEAAVEEMISGPDVVEYLPDDLIMRFHVDMNELRFTTSSAGYWLYRMITTNYPMQEKIALFWHGIFATAYSKLNQARSLLNQIDMFRNFGMGNLRDLLVELSKDPAMIIWLDNNENHKGAINENYGRELLELFSMGVGNYTEDDVKECARAFTGWTLGNAEYMATRAAKDSLWPYGRIAWHFEYRDYDHDDGEKTFLGETGNFNGEDIIDIICKQPATAKFISRHLYDFFVADEPPVPQWPYTPPRDPEAIEILSKAYFESGYNIGAMLRALFNSDFFKNESARFARIKNPIEMAVGAFRFSGNITRPSYEIGDVAEQCLFMNQGPMQPPSVEGWHEGVEWIDSGTLVERVNFASKELSDIQQPGARSIIDRLANTDGGILSPSSLVNNCLELLGAVNATDDTKATLVTFAEQFGDVDLSNHKPGDDAEKAVGNIMRLIASTKEYQLC